MSQPVQGIHHITAIGSDPQQVYDFYTKVLGLRLVKKTVNQDDTSAYHLFFGDTLGGPGMDLTFFTFPQVMQGMPGVGQVTRTGLTVPAASISFWEQQLEKHQVNCERQQLFGTERLLFADSDGQQFALIGVEQDELSFAEEKVWSTDEVSAEHAVRSFHSAQLTVSSLRLIDPVLVKAFGYQLAEREDGVYRYYLNDGRARQLEVAERPLLEPGINAAGTVHHIAFVVEDLEHEMEIRERVLSLGLYPTEMIDRYYFKSVYFRTPAGILFELATKKPGFTIDEDESELGEALSLPPFLEERREQIEQQLPPIDQD